MPSIHVITAIEPNMPPTNICTLSPDRNTKYYYAGMVIHDGIVVECHVSPDKSMAKVFNQSDDCAAMLRILRCLEFILWTDFVTEWYHTNA